MGFVTAREGGGGWAYIYGFITVGGRGGGL